MPYALKGNCVIKKYTGEVIKCHASRKEAVAHLRALYANVKKSAIDKTVMVAKGAPLGNRNAAKDYVSPLGEWSDSPLRALEVGQSHYKQIQSAWSDAMDAAYHHDMKKMIQSSAMAENRYKLLQAVVSRSQYKSSRMLMPDVDVPEDVVQAEVQAHNRLYGVLEDAKELVMAIRTAKRRLKSVV